MADEVKSSLPFPYFYIQSEISHLLCFKHNILLVTGLEPVRDRSRRILSPLRLPIPPHQHMNNMILGSKGILILINGWRWIRTTEAICSRFTVCPLWPLGNPSISEIPDNIHLYHIAI